MSNTQENRNTISLRGDISVYVVKNALLTRTYYGIKFPYLFCFICLFFTQLSIGWGQTTIVSDGLNNTSSLFTISGGNFYTGNSGTTDTPPSQPFAIEGTHSRGISNGTATLTSSTISTLGYTNISLSLRAAAFAINDNTGFENTDYIRIDISTNGGSSYTTNLTVTGNNSSNWAYSATGIASATFGLAATFAPSAGGTRTTDGYSTLLITNLPETSNLRIRISMNNSTTAELWLIDDFKITGIPCAPVNSFPYTQNFDLWVTSPDPEASCVSDGTISLQQCWTNESGDNIDWIVWTGGTNSGNTGPGSDHTSGSGKYLYTESSGGAGCNNAYRIYYKPCI